MSFDFLFFGEYTFFVWIAYLFTFLCCFNLYFTSKKAFEKYEKIYQNEFGKLTYSKENNVKYKDREAQLRTSII